MPLELHRAKCSFLFSSKQNWQLSPTKDLFPDYAEAKVRLLRTMSEVFSRVRFLRVERAPDSIRTKTSAVNCTNANCAFRRNATVAPP